MRQWLTFKIGYVCQIPQEGGGRAYLANSLLMQLLAMPYNRREQQKRVFFHYLRHRRR